MRLVPPAPQPSRMRSQGGRERGLAMVMVMVMAGLLTVLVVVFMAFSADSLRTSNAQVSFQRTEEILVGAQYRILADLRNEMKAGSALESGVPQIWKAGNGVLHYPATAANAVPWRTGAESGPVLVQSLPPHLVKWSSRSHAFFPWDPSRYPSAMLYPPAGPAAASSTMDRSRNGVVVLPGVWNRSWLIPKKLPALETSDFSYAKAPLPPAGINVFPLPDWVLMTRSGSRPVNLFQIGADPVIGRYAFAMYDEGALLNVCAAGVPAGLERAEVARKGSPGFADLGPALKASGMVPAQADAFVQSLVQWRNAGTLAGGAQRYRDFLLNNPAGFLRIANSGDRFPASRQEFIRLVLKRLPGNLAARQNFLQYASVFSRDLAQPSFVPNPAQPWNPPVLNVRVRMPFVRFDGTRALEGEPLVKKRFPLGRLGLVAPYAVASQADPVNRFFGLTRASAKDPWLYRGGASQIKTLSQLAGSEAREADFFELLKAAVRPEALVGDANDAPALDAALIQLGANLIDQADSDSLPTRIQFNGRIFCGIEDLPYFHALRTAVTVLPKTPPAETPKPGESMVWEQVRLWNPHRVSATGGAASGTRPTAFELEAEKPVAYSAKGVALEPVDLKGVQFKFEVPQTAAGSLLFREPTWLGVAGEPEGANLELGQDNAFQGGLVYPPPEGTAPQAAIGIALAIRGPKGVSESDVFTPGSSDPVSYRLKYWDAALNEWVVYSERSVPPSEARYVEEDDSGGFSDPRSALSEGAGGGADSKAPRPVMLNRPFRTVGETAFAFSGMPWRPVDFTRADSGFGGLLDVFCAQENLHPQGLEAGRVSLNSLRAPVLEGLLAGTYQDEPDGAELEGAVVQALAAELTAATANPKRGPVRNPSELPGRMTGPGAAAGVRALVDAGSTRVWNLFIDLVVQSGRYPQEVDMGRVDYLSDFIVEGSRHVWLHVALDRLTGEVLDQQLEEVSD